MLPAEAAPRRPCSGLSCSTTFKSTAADYQANNSVRWEKGKLLLGPGADLNRPIQAGAVVELTAKLAFPPLAQDGDEAETRIGFTIENAGVVAGVTFYRRRDHGKRNGEIRICRSTGPTRTPPPTAGKFPWLPRAAAEEWRIGFRYGVIEVAGRPTACRRLYRVGRCSAGQAPLGPARWEDRVSFVDRACRGAATAADPGTAEGAERGQPRQ